MVGGALTHLKSLRRFEDDRGWIKTLLDEAQNERAHLMTFSHLAKPNWFERVLVIAAQGVFFNVFFFMYLFWPRATHRYGRGAMRLPMSVVLRFGQHHTSGGDDFFVSRSLPSYRNLAADLDHCVSGKLEVVGQARGVALHKGKQRLKPAWLSLPVAPRDDGLMAHIIGDVIEIDVTAANVSLF
jgi:Alternative oxidase